MLIKLFNPVKVTESVAPISLPTGCPFGGMPCSVSGWGNTAASGDGALLKMIQAFLGYYIQLVYCVFSCLLAIMPNRLQCLDVPVVSDEDCDKAYPGMITRRMMCAGYMEGGRDACNVRTTANERKHRYTPAHTPSMCLTGRLRQPPGVLRRSPRPGVVGSGVRPSQLPRSLRQSVWIPLLDRWRPTNLLLDENHPVVSLHIFVCFGQLFYKFPSPKNTKCSTKMQENQIKPLGKSSFSYGNK